jgi:phage terminase large subunit-like protein
MAESLFEELQTLTKQEAIERVSLMPQEMAADLTRRPWWFIGRPEQQEPPGNWNVWLILSGRGWGKTRTGSEWLAQQVLAQPYAPDGTPTEWAIIAETFSDTRIMCVEGPSGIMRVLERIGLKQDVDFTYNKSLWQINFASGQRIHMFGADNPDAGRGFNLAGVWADEVAKWRYPYETWFEGIAPALRIGKHPRACVTTTPKPIQILREWVKREDGSVYVTRGSTFDNSTNLSAAALTELQARYNGTRVGRQELYGELLEDVEGALWTRGVIDRNRLTTQPPLARIVVSIDPAVTNTQASDETGIVVCGSDTQGHGYVIADYSFKGSPLDWATKAVEVFDKHKADHILVEVNQGGDMVSAVLKQVRVGLPVREVRAHVGKKLRAEPIAAMYEQGRIHHINDFAVLEDQMTTWTPDEPSSPDRLDAMVQGFADLLGTSSVTNYLNALANFCSNCGLPMPKSMSHCSKCGTAMIKPQKAEGE